MDQIDLENLQFISNLMTLDTIDTWYASISEDELIYAIDLLTYYKRQRANILAQLT